MHLKLTNVRQHSKAALELPSVGLVKLSGVSGKGKTTILDAVEDVLFGTGSDIQPWTGGSAMEELSIPELDLVITRKRNPFYLKVIHGGKEYIDDEAQEIINQTLGMDANEFSACSYIKQEGAGSLLTLPPTEQLKFIQRLSIGDFDPEEFKQKTVLLIKEKGLEDADKKRQLTSFIGQIDDSELYIATNELVEPAPVEGNKDKLILDNAELELGLAITKKESATATALLLSNKEEKATALKQELATYEGLLTELKDSIVPIQDAKLDPHTLKSTKQKLILDNANIEKQITYLVAAESAKLRIGEISSLFNHTGPGIVEKLQGLVTGYDKSIIDIKLKLSQLVQENQKLDEFKDHSCPHCEKPVAIVNGKIVKEALSADEVQKERDTYLTCIGVVSAELDRLLTDSKNAKTHLDELLAIKKGMPSSVPGFTGISKESLHDTLAVTIESILQIDNQIKDLEFAAKNEQANQDKITKLTVQIARIKSDIDKLGPVQSIDKQDLGKKIETFAAIIATYEDQIKKNNQAIVELDLYEERKRSYLSNKSIIDNSRKTLAGTIIAKNKLEEEITQLNQTIAAAERLKEVTDFAATSAIESTVEQINQYAANFIDKMFPDDGTSIQITNTSKTQKGEERAKIGIDIYHKGKKAKKLSNFSGGEKARVRMAFQGGLAEMYKSPIMLLDEPLSGLDEETKEVCMEVLKELAKNRLVIVIEHGSNDSHFDKVVEL